MGPPFFSPVGSDQEQERNERKAEHAAWVVSLLSFSLALVFTFVVPAFVNAFPFLPFSSVCSHTVTFPSSSFFFTSCSFRVWLGAHIHLHTGGWRVGATAG